MRYVYKLFDRDTGKYATPRGGYYLWLDDGKSWARQGYLIASIRAHANEIPAYRIAMQRWRAILSEQYTKERAGLFEDARELRDEANDLHNTLDSTLSLVPDSWEIVEVPVPEPDMAPTGNIKVRDWKPKKCR